MRNDNNYSIKLKIEYLLYRIREVNIPLNERLRIIEFLEQCMGFYEDKSEEYLINELNYLTRSMPTKKKRTGVLNVRGN